MLFLVKFSENFSVYVALYPVTNSLLRRFSNHAIFWAQIDEVIMEICWTPTIEMRLFIEPYLWNSTSANNILSY